MHRFIIVSIFICLSPSLNGQHTALLKSSIGSGSQLIAPGKIRLSTIIGQPSPVGAVRNGLTLSQGFQFKYLSQTGLADRMPSIQVYPNPTRGTLYFRSTSHRDEQLDIELYDLHGRLIERFTFLIPEQVNQKDFDIAPGFYTLRMKTSTSPWISQPIIFL
jgi:hypothetical protein